MNFYIYKITNPNGKVYIGRTIKENIFDRIKAYERLYKSTKRQVLLYNSIVKYGWDNHKWEVIYKSKNTTLDVDSVETIFIDFFNSYNSKYGLNLTRVGNSPMTGKNHTPEAIAKVKASSIGRKHTDRTKALISASSKAYSNNKETKNKLAERNRIGKYGQYVKWTQEMKNAVTERLKRDYKLGRRKNFNTKKSVKCYNLDGSLYKIFDSIKAALEDLGKPYWTKQYLREALSDSSKIVHDKYWKYGEKENKDK